MADFVIEGFGQRKVITAPEGSDFSRLRDRGWTVTPAAGGAAPPTPSRKVAPEGMSYGESLVQGAADPWYEVRHLEQMGVGDRAAANQAMRERETDLQRRGISGPMRAIGAAGMTTAMTAPLGAIPGVAGRVLGGPVVQGALGGLLEPSTGREPGLEKAGQVGLGAAGGAALKGVGRFARTSRTPTPDELRDLGKNVQADIIRELGGDPAKQTSRQGQLSLTSAQTQQMTKAQETRWDRAINAQIGAHQADRKLQEALQAGVPDVGALKATLAVGSHLFGVPTSVIRSALENYLDEAAPRALRAEAKKILDATGLKQQRSGSWILTNAERFSPAAGTLAGETVDYPVAPDALSPRGSGDALRR